MTNEKIIGIVGGVGPAAGTLLHQYIIEETRSSKKVDCDQDHLTILHVSVSPWISDRTRFLLDDIEENPAIGAGKVVEIVSQVARGLDKPCVVGIPCNTFHAEPIFDDLLRRVLALNLDNVEILNMVQEAVKHIRAEDVDLTRVGLMSTSGTRKHGTYHVLLEQSGFEVIEVDANLQPALDDSIYNKEWGLKGVSPVSHRAQENFREYARRIIDKGAEVLILGCTEIPLAFTSREFNGVPLIDPMRSLAKALVENATAPCRVSASDLANEDHPV